MKREMTAEQRARIVEGAQNKRIRRETSIGNALVVGNWKTFRLDDCNWVVMPVDGDDGDYSYFPDLFFSLRYILRESVAAKVTAGDVYTLQRLLSAHENALGDISAALRKYAGKI